MICSYNQSQWTLRTYDNFMWEERLETTVLYLEKQATKQSLAPVVQLSRRLIYLKPNTQKWFWKTDCKYITPFPCLRCIKYQPVLVWYQLFNIPAESTSFSSFQRLPVCSHKHIEGWLKICTPYLIYCHFFCTSSMDDCYLILYICPWYWNWYKIGIGWYYLKSRVATRLCIVSSNTSLVGCASYQYESVDCRCKSIYTRPTLVSTTLHLSRIRQLLFGASSSQHLSKFWVELWNNQHPFQHCNSCPLMSMKVTQKICTTEFPKLEIGVRLAYHIATFVFCDSGCLPSFWVSSRKKKFSFKQSWTAQRESAPNSWLAMLDMIYESNIWKSTNHHGIVSLPFMLNFQTKIMRDDRTVLRHDYVILVAKWTWWRKSNQIQHHDGELSP